MFWFLSHVDSLLIIGDRHWRKVAAMFKKADSANSLPFVVHVHMGAYKRDVVVVIKMGAYIHGVLILCGCLLSRFEGNQLMIEIGECCFPIRKLESAVFRSSVSTGLGPNQWRQSVGICV